MKKSEYELLASQWDDEAMETDEAVLKSLVLYENSNNEEKKNKSHYSALNGSQEILF